MTRLILTTIGIAVIVGVVIYGVRIRRSQSTGASNQHTRPISIPGIQEPEEMRVEPFPFGVVFTPAERMLGEAMEQAGGKNSPSALLPALNRILAKYPDFSDGYTMRLGSLCEGNDRAAILADINNALRYSKNSRVDSTASLLSMRAKIEHTNGDDSAAIEDLGKAIHGDPAEPTKFVNSGAVAPEQSASTCTWTVPDMDALVQRYPNDYRAYLFRGLYYGFFATWSEDSVIPAIENLQKSSEKNTNSALPHAFIAYVLKRAYVIKRLGWSDAQRTRMNEAILKELNAALTIDPNLLMALKDRAEAFFELKLFQQAIADYDKIVTLDPTDDGAYNDRALAKMELGQTYDAISDFGKAIEKEKRELQHSNSYEGRADAYMKTEQWELAIRDFTTAISLQTGGIVLLSNIKQFRSLYPEYAAASDEAIAHKLQQTFYPAMTYENFSKEFLDARREFWESTPISDLYLKRSDAYLRSGKWKRAASEYRRASEGFPDTAKGFDRWRDVNSRGYPRMYIDMKTFDATQSRSAKAWIKRVDGAKEVGPYSMEQYEVNCGERQIRNLSSARYDAAGTFIGSQQDGKWGSIVPDTLAETLFDGICRDAS